MADPIFERYKEALRAGHVAALRGRLDDALVQYRAAAAIAPDRPLPHVGMADALLLLGRVDEALGSCRAALQRAPADPAALEVAARVHEAAGQTGEAAACLDRLADALLETESLDAACAASIRARDLNPTDVRRRRAEELASTRHAALGSLPPEPGPDRGAGVRVPAGTSPGVTLPDGQGEPQARAADVGEAGAASPASHAAESHVAEAKRGARHAAAPVLPALVAPVSEHEPAQPGDGGSGTVGAATIDSTTADTATADLATPDIMTADAAIVDAGPAALAGAAPPGAMPQEAPDTPAPSVESGPAPTGPLGGPDPEAAFAAADERAAAGDPRGAAELYVRAAEACLSMGASRSAVDECLRALAGAPGDTEVHLELARIHVATGHVERAGQTLDLLERLLSLDGDGDGLATVEAFRRAAAAPLPAGRRAPPDGASGRRRA